MWNVVVSVREHAYRAARRLLRPFGAIDRTDYYNILALEVADVKQFLEALRQTGEADPNALACLARVIPATHTFQFQTADEFGAHAKAAAADFVPQLAGKRFYVRMHRRGFRGTLSSQHEEQFLDHFLLESLKQSGSPGEITFADPDAVVAVETIGQWAGLSLWTREERERYPFLRFD